LIIELNIVPIRIAVSARRLDTDTVGIGISIELGTTIVIDRFRFGFSTNRSKRVLRPNRLTID